MKSGGNQGSHALRLAGVTKSFRGHLGIGRTVAIEGLSLEVQRGEIFGLLGPNGAGKTTTLKTILGLLRPDHGEVTLWGLAPTDAASRIQVGFLPEQPYFYDYLTAREFLDFYGRLSGLSGAERKERIPSVLRRVGLEGKEGIPLRKFSKGMVQRIGLAQAILHDPALVILDEPMSGLDPVGRREVRDLILSLKDAGRTVLFSSHILQDAELLCDRVAILVQGRLRQTGSLEALLSREVRWFEVVVSGVVPDAFVDQRMHTSGGEALVRLPDVSSLTAFLAEVSRTGAQVVSVWPRRETLEDLFLREIGATPRPQAGPGGSP